MREFNLGDIVKNNIAELVLFMFILTSAGFWYRVWVEPHDAFLGSVVDCMNDAGQNSRYAYDTCVEEVINENR